MAVDAPAPSRSGPRSAAAGHSRGAEQIRAAFQRAADAGRAALVTYSVAGYPDAETSERIALAMADSGADLLEIGLPYSDPLADGLTVQRASMAALAAGATLDRSIALVASVHRARPDVPLVPMGYVNQVLGGRDRMGVLDRLADAGASGLILSDLTPEEADEIEERAQARGLSNIYLVTPTTPLDRQRSITERSTGFVYAVSLTGVTGARTSLPPGVLAFLRQVRSVSPVPVAVGFGISKPEHARKLARAADGVVVGSALVDALGPDGRDVDRMSRLVRSLADATGR
jgi:tryptophan synthase alpha chain